MALTSSLASLSLGFLICKMGADGNIDFTESLEEPRACEGQNTAFWSDRAIVHRAGGSCGCMHKSYVRSSQSEFRGVSVWEASTESRSQLRSYGSWWLWGEGRSVWFRDGTPGNLSIFQGPILMHLLAALNGLSGLKKKCTWIGRKKWCGKNWRGWSRVGLFQNILLSCMKFSTKQNTKQSTAMDKQKRINLPAPLMTRRSNSRLCCGFIMRTITLSSPSTATMGL